MVFQRIAIVVVSMGALLLGCMEGAGESPSASVQNEADIAVIHAFFDRYGRTWTDGLGEEYMSLLSDDIIAMVPGAPAIVGKKAVGAGMGPVFEHNKLDFVVTVEEVRVSGDWAFVRTAIIFRGTPKDGGEAFEGIGKAVYLLERQPNDSWRIARDIYNWDHPNCPS